MKHNYNNKNVYAAEKIVAKKKSRGKMLYKIRWVGYGPADDTWEPFENLSEALKKGHNQFDCTRNKLGVGRSDSFIYVFDETAKLRINELACTASFFDTRHARVRRQFKVDKVSGGYVVTAGKHEDLYPQFYIYVDKSKVESVIPFEIAQK